MLFNSQIFLIFFIIVYILYILLNQNLKWQNRMLLVASCIFYGAWDWRFIFLMYISISVDFFCGINIQKSNSQRIRKRFLLISILVNLLILGFFKYFNFFALNLQALLNYLGVPLSLKVLNIILPVGISFYTFEAMSYIIDVYQRRMEATRSYLDYALFVTYFPHLVAGPIMRAKNLIPQITSKRELTLNKFYEGCYLIGWGLFQKVFVADNLARIVNSVFAGNPPYNGFAIMVALYAFAFQIYGDFAGYSNIARGLGKCMGFDIMINFNLPYFSSNPADFWNRWHISLSSWLRDYLYIPLGGNRKGNLITYRNLGFTMLLGGLWHGASWTFIAWGAYHGFLLIIHRLFNERVSLRFNFKSLLVLRMWSLIKILFFFHLVCLGWLLFRAESLNQVYEMCRALFFNFNFFAGIGLKALLSTIWLLLVIEYFSFKRNNPNALLRFSVWVRALAYVIIYYSLIIYGARDGQEFIYFQF